MRSRPRIRVCGICEEDKKILLVKHLGFGKTGTFWCPPGGGVEFGESLHEALKREFLEETGIEIVIKNLLYVNEFIELPLHALEFFFEVEKVGGELFKGIDPELDKQIIDDVAWLGFGEIKQLPTDEIHSIFQKFKSLDDIRTNKPYLALKTQ